MPMRLVIPLLSDLIHAQVTFFFIIAVVQRDRLNRHVVDETPTWWEADQRDQIYQHKLHRCDETSSKEPLGTSSMKTAHWRPLQSTSSAQYFKRHIGDTGSK